MTVPITLVSDIRPRSQFTADGVQVAFPCDWPLREADDLRLIFNAGDEININYTITGINDDAGFTVTFDTPPASGTLITLLRRGTLERSAVYGQQTRFLAETLNTEISDIFLRLQELKARLDRTLQLSDTDGTAITVLPASADRASKFLGFDSNGNVVVLASPGQLALDFNQFPSETPVGADLFIFNDVSDTTGSPVRKATLQELAALLSAISDQPFRTVADVGLHGDGTTDDSFLLQQDMDAQTLTGGCSYWLRSPIAGGSFYLAHSPRVPSNIIIVMSSPFLLAKGSTFSIRGRRAAAASAEGFRLLANITAGASVARVDTAPHGGGLVSAHFAVGDYFEIVGLLDGCATPASEEEHRVASINNGLAEITVAGTFASSYSVTYPAAAYETNYGTPNRAIIRKLVFAIATANLDEGDNLVLIRAGDVGKLVAGDMVQVKDDTRTADLPGAAGSTSVTCFEEYALIVPSVSGDPASSVRLDRRATRNFTLAKNLRLVKINPVTGSVLSGARMLAAEAPDLDPAPIVPWLEQRYAKGCIFSSCVVPNTDVFGKRGTAFNFYRCLEPRADNCDALKAKYFDDGEGNGISFDRCTGGKATGGIMDSMRHATQCVSGSGNSFHEITMTNPRHAPMDLHGTYEVDCHWYDCTLVGATQYEAGEGRSPVALAFGNSTFLAGAHRCGFHGGTVVGFSSDSGSIESAINFMPGSTRCEVDSTFKSIRQLFRYGDKVGFGTLLSSGHRIRARVDGCTDTRMVDLDGRRNGASVDTLLDTRIEIYGRNINGGIYAVNCTELEIANCDLDEATLDPSATYFVQAQSCTGLRVIGNRTFNFGRFLSLTDCLNYRAINNTVIDQTFSTVLQDLGGCTGVWLDNRAVGFLPFYDPAATSSITIDGRLPGHWDLPDDSVLIIKPVHPKGISQFSSVTGTNFEADFYYNTVTPSIDLGGFTSANVESSTAALTGTTGTDGKVTIAVVGADDTIRIENRTGVTIRVNGRVD